MQTPGAWEFRFPSNDLRYVRFKINEYLGDAVAVNHIEIGGRGIAHSKVEAGKAADDTERLYIPTDSDVLELSNNNTLEIAGGDVVSAGYTDEFTQNENSNSLLLSEKLFATYFNATIGAINYDFIRLDNGQVQNIQKVVVRSDPGERFVVEITDYDLDTTVGQDTLEFEVSVNDGEPIKLSAIEKESNQSGTFTKEIDTILAGSSAAETDNTEGKLKVKPGDRIVVRYLDAQNTFPGHSVKRESVVYVNKPTTAQIRIVETRVVPGNSKQNTAPQAVYLKEADAKDRKEVAQVAFEAPLTIEVIDPDMAKDSKSEVLVTLTTTDGAKIEARCVISGEHAHFGIYQTVDAERWALEEGRFLGQVILQLGSKASADVVPLASEMPRNLIGGGKLDESQTNSGKDRSLVTRFEPHGQRQDHRDLCRRETTRREAAKHSRFGRADRNERARDKRIFEDRCYDSGHKTGDDQNGHNKVRDRNGQDGNRDGEDNGPGSARRTAEARDSDRCRTGSPDQQRCAGCRRSRLRQRDHATPRRREVVSASH